MRGTIKQRTCDTCKKVVSASEECFGGSVWQGWLYIEKTDGSSRCDDRDRGPWDFCSFACAAGKLDNNEISEQEDTP